MPNQYTSAPVALTCGICTSPFTVQAYRAATARYCSKACATAGQWQRKSITCTRCGESFSVIRHRAKAARYCSRRCRDAGAKRPLPIVELSADGLTALVPLLDRTDAIRGYATIDADKAVWVGQWRWHLLRSGYAARTDVTGPRRAVFLHRELLGLPRIRDGREGDHIDRDKLNDRLSNLRVVTHAQNMQNLTPRQGMSSQYRGVGWDKSRSKWVAYVMLNGKMHNLGYFSDESGAAEVARLARERVFSHSAE
jgi:hypothetical protein